MPSLGNINIAIAIACALLAPWPALAAAPPQPASPCARALRAAPADRSAGQAAPRKKINPNGLRDPCGMADADTDSRIANNAGLSQEETLSRIDAAVEWNRRLADDPQHDLPWWAPARATAAAADQSPDGMDSWRQRRAADQVAASLDVRRPWPWQEQAAMPAVPEPHTYALWLAGLALLAARARRRRPPPSGGKAPPAARR